jgi:hypothetical protein
MARKHESRLRWWIKHRLLSPKYLWQDLWWGFLHRTFYRYNIIRIKTLKPGYYDVDHRMLHANFQLLVDYVEREKPFDHIDWDTDEESRHVASEIRELYDWWKNKYPKRLLAYETIPDEECPDLMEIWRKTGVVSSPEQNENMREKYPNYYRTLETSWEQEKRWDKEEEDNLIRLMKIRQYLWT